MDRDYYMTAEEAKEYGIIDRVIDAPLTSRHRPGLAEPAKSE